ncbi:sodium:solute symporter family transporter [Anaeromicrobium sediminis]|uniref:Sodium/proline symporter n=1 Tax=Anaeromicrobium sediminis TaxID=1478221 RepID=A0A267MKN5_9FIRM|nr:sodium/solute symporter [Anaeromicrobium sediminis]PAB60096.1 hypothetical protein CCE28_06905 [Anaeromicrobium sediminis]
MINKFMIMGFSLFYFTITIIIGIIASVRPQNIEMYFLGGRKTNAFILALAFTATSMSGLLFLGFSGMIYEEGLQSLWIIIPSSIVGIVLCYKIVSRRVRVYSEYTGALTVIEILKKRYVDNNNLLTYITGFMILSATLMYVSGQLIAAGKLINVTIGLPYDYSIIIFATIMITYIVIGGFNAVCWTDVFQGISMIMGSFLAGVVVLKISKGLSFIWADMKYVNSIHPKFYLSPIDSTTNIILGITTFIGDGIMNWLGQPTLMTKYMSVRNTDKLKSAGLMSVSFQIILFGGVLITSLYMRTQFENPVSLPLSGDTETVFIQFFMYMMNPFWSGVVLAGIIAAIMSTADSLIMLTSSILVNDIYYVKRPQSSPRHLIIVSRLITIFLGTTIIFIAFSIKSVLTTAWIGWSILGLVGVPVLMGLYWEKATLSGAIWAQITGFLVLIIWIVFDLTSKLHIFYAFAAGITSYLTLFLVSIFSKKSPMYIRKEIIELNNDFKYKGHIEI